MSFPVHYGKFPPPANATLRAMLDDFPLLEVVRISEEACGLKDAPKRAKEGSQP